MSRIPALAAVTSIVAASAFPVFAEDFNGAYTGISVAGGFNAPIVPDLEGTWFGGYNVGLGNGFVLGGELGVAVNPLSLWDGLAVTSKLDARAGYRVVDDVLVYGRAGGGYTTGGPGSMVWDVGAGAEYMIKPDVSLRGEFERVDPFAAGMDTQYNAKAGVAYNF